MKRKMCFTLTFLMAAMLILLSCGNSDDSNESDVINSLDNNSQGVSDSQEGIVKDIAYEYGGEQIDFNGETFTILYPQWALYEEYYFAEEEIGDAVNDALYRRIKNTEEFFNINIQVRDVPSIDSIEPEISREVMAGTNSFDIALTHCISGLSNIVSKNIAYNWANMPNVDYSKKYWNQSVMEYLNINGYMPFVANDFILPDPCFLTFSKDLIKQYDLEDPYAIVKSGNWTWDKLTEMAKQVSQDLNGDGIFDENDLYGFVGELDWMFINAMYACNQRVLKKEADGSFILDVNTQKTQTMIEKFYNLLFVGNQTFTYEYNSRADGRPFIAFDSGRALFYMSVPNHVRELRATEFDFGILPYPKFDKNQEEYISLNWAGTICAPLNIDNPEKVGAVVEYLGAVSREIVLPAYFDILLTGKLARDDESAAMLDIIYGNSIYDFGLNFSGFNDLLYLVPRLLQNESTDVASFYESRAHRIQEQYDRIYEAFIVNSEG